MSESLAHNKDWSIASKAAYIFMAAIILLSGPCLSIYAGIADLQHMWPLVGLGVIWGIPCVYCMYQLLKNLSKDVVELPEYLASIFVLSILVGVFLGIVLILSMLLMLIAAFVISFATQDYGSTLACGFCLLIVAGLFLMEWYNKREITSS